MLEYMHYCFTGGGWSIAWVVPVLKWTEGWIQTDEKLQLLASSCISSLANLSTFSMSSPSISLFVLHEFVVCLWCSFEMCGNLSCKKQICGHTRVLQFEKKNASSKCPELHQYHAPLKVDKEDKLMHCIIPFWSHFLMSSKTFQTAKFSTEWLVVWHYS